jgi:hypothetical protein
LDQKLRGKPADQELSERTPVFLMELVLVAAWPRFEMASLR